MCFSETASWTTFAIGAAGVVAFVAVRQHYAAALGGGLAHDNEKDGDGGSGGSPTTLLREEATPQAGETAVLAVLFVAITVVQLYEALLWRNLRTGAGIGGDGAVERLTLATTTLHPVILGGGMLLHYADRRRRGLPREHWAERRAGNVAVTSLTLLYGALAAM